MKLQRMDEFTPAMFTTKTGKLVITARHYASFDNHHNASKSKVFIVLYHRKFTLRDNTGLSARQLADHTGVSYNYVRSRIIKWTAWGYVKRSTEIVDNRPLLVYTIADRGKHFIEDILPQDALDAYLLAIRQERQK